MNNEKAWKMICNMVDIIEKHYLTDDEVLLDKYHFDSDIFLSNIKEELDIA